MRIVLLLLALAACGPESKPAGTTSDPVETCRESAQVCRFSGSQLGVCTRQPDGALSCSPQH